jgi:hypothetical protein
VIGFFRGLKETLNFLKVAVSNLSVWKSGVNNEMTKLQEEIKTLKLLVEELKAKREFLSEDEVDYVKLVNAFSERNYERLASWVDLSGLTARLSGDNLKEIASNVDLRTLCLDHLLPRVVQSVMDTGIYHKLLHEASITARKQVLAELTENLLWNNKQEVFDAAAKVLASDQFLRDHYPKLVTALAQELKKVFYLVPLAREVAKQPEVQQRAANYLADRIVTALSSDASTTVAAVRPNNTTTFMD